MQVFEINDRRVGHVRVIRDCCFEVQSLDSDQTFELTPAAIFTVESQRATLVCDRSALAGYACPVHTFPNSVPGAGRVVESGK
ncbi:MAG: hypothetical protein WBO97_03400 [Tepidiformaceae bacterium]